MINEWTCHLFVICNLRWSLQWLLSIKAKPWTRLRFNCLILLNPDGKNHPSSTLKCYKCFMVLTKILVMRLLFSKDGSVWIKCTEISCIGQNLTPSAVLQLSLWLAGCFSALHVCVNAALLQLPGSRTPNISTQKNTKRKVFLFCPWSKKKSQKLSFVRGGDIISCPKKRWFFFFFKKCSTVNKQLLSDRLYTGKTSWPLSVTVTWMCVSLFECHISLSRFIITVFLSRHSSCFCLALSSCYGNVTTRLAAFEINSKSWHANKSGAVFICGDLFSTFEAPENIWCEWINYL